jgi:hypothetical protein
MIVAFSGSVTTTYDWETNGSVAPARFNDDALLSGFRVAHCMGPPIPQAAGVARRRTTLIRDLGTPEPKAHPCRSASFENTPPTNRPTG